MKNNISHMNEVICKFMDGYKKVRNINIYKGPDEIEWETGMFLKYHSDWNWLMPIWIKFKNLNLKNDEYWQWLESLSYYLTTSDEPKRFHERLFYAIDWYNKQQQ